MLGLAGEGRVPWQMGAKESHRNHTMQKVSYKRFIEGWGVKGCYGMGMREREKQRPQETEGKRTGCGGWDLLKGVCVGSWR